MLHNLLTGIRMVQPVLIEAVQTLGAKRRAVIAHVIFPATLPNLMTGIRLGIAFGFRSLVGGEMIASTNGLGYAIFNAQQYFQSARIVVGMLAIGITWLIMDRLDPAADRAAHDHALGPGARRASRRRNRMYAFGAAEGKACAWLPKSAPNGGEDRPPTPCKQGWDKS